MSYTEGPWKVLRLDGEIYINPSRESGEYALLAKVHGARVPPGRSEDTAQANARLIASAPDLLSALTALVESIENVNFSVHDDDGRTYDTIPWAQAEAAIAKAHGQEGE